MTAPSNANTSGLSVVAWRWREKGTPMDWRFEGDAPTHQDLRWNEAEPLVTAASAQAAIDEQEETIESLKRLVDQHYDRATAAEARADRLAKALEFYAEPVWSIDGSLPKASPISEYRPDCGDTARAALQQETQP